MSKRFRPLNREKQGEVWANSIKRGKEQNIDTHDAELLDKLNELYARFNRENNKQPSPSHNGDVTDVYRR